MQLEFAVSSVNTGTTPILTLVTCVPVVTLLQGPKNALARMQLEFAVSSVNTGIAAAVAQLSVAIPNVKFLVLDWYSIMQAISE